TFGFATDISLVNFNDAGKLLTEIRVFPHSDSDAMSHVPCSSIVHFKLALQLERRDTLLDRTDHVNGQEQFSQGKVRIVKDASDCDRVLMTAGRAPIQETLGRFSAHATGFVASTADASKSVRPANLLEMADARFLGVELADCLEQ